MFFEALLTHIGKLGLDLAAHLPEGVFGDADPIGLGYAFEASGDIDPIAEDIITFDQHVAEMDAHAPFHSALAGQIGVAFLCELLESEGAFNGTNDRGELNQHAIAGRLNDPPTMLRDDRIRRGAMLAQCLRGACLIEPHEPTVTNEIGGKDCSETTYSRHGSPGDKVRLTKSTPKLAMALARRWRSLSLQFHL